MIGGSPHKGPVIRNAFPFYDIIPCRYDDTLQWRHNGCDSVSNHHPPDCLLNRWFRRRSKRTSKLRVTGLCAGNSPGVGEFPAQLASNASKAFVRGLHRWPVNSPPEWPVTRKMFPFDDVIMFTGFYQQPWWRHDVKTFSTCHRWISPSKGPVIMCFDDFFDVSPSNLLKKNTSRLLVIGDAVTLVILMIWLVTDADKIARCVVSGELRNPKEYRSGSGSG